MSTFHGWCNELPKTHAQPRIGHLLSDTEPLRLQLMADARLEEQLGGVSEDTAEDLILNSDANRVLQQVQRKLEGKEREGGGQVASVKGQVQQLLQEARSTDNLCQMYVGWASWR